jgi:replication factor C small subunit
MRRALNALQGASLHSKKIDSDLIHKISSRAKPKEVHEMVDLAISGDFKSARSKLDKLIIHYGLSGEDILNQVYREIPLLNIPEKKKVVLIDRIGEYNFRLVQGASERIQIESMLAQFGIIGEVEKS